MQEGDAIGPTDPPVDLAEAVVLVGAPHTEGEEAEDHELATHAGEQGVEVHIASLDHGDRRVSVLVVPVALGIFVRHVMRAVDGAHTCKSKGGSSASSGAVTARQP